MPTSQVAVQSNIWENNSILKEKRQNTKNQNYMPFLFRSKRQFPQQKQQIPPVGSYQVPSLFDKLTTSNASNQLQILKQKFQRKNQMCVFKSSQERFLQNNNDIPEPASYNCITNQASIKTLKSFNQKVDNHKKRQIYQILKKSPSCPAIPDSKVRYGYAKDPQGKFKLIEKTENQVLKEKQKLKQYCSTLVGQNNYSKGLRKKQPQPIINQLKVISKLEKYVDQRQNSLTSSLIDLNYKREKTFKPKIKLSYGAKVIKVSNDHLGPGCYNVSLDTVKKTQKKENYQFFSSSQIRFAPLNKSANVNPYEHIFEEKKNLKIKINLPGKIYKKSFPTYIDPNCFQKIENPGPGYYEPEIAKIKKSQGNVKFGYDSRFKQKLRHDYSDNDTKKIEEQVQNEEGMKWGNLRKQKIRSPHKEYDPVQQQEIYGIMNEGASDQNIHAKQIKLKNSKNKQSAVFLDRCSRLNLCNRTYYQGQNLIGQKGIGTNMWKTKGSFMSKLGKGNNEMKENTPGPGAYKQDKLGKKTFNIKNS